MREFKNYVFGISDIEGMIEYENCLRSRNRKKEVKEKNCWGCLKWRLRWCAEKDRVLINGDMTAKVNDREVENTVGKFWLLGVNENRGKLIDLCME